MDDALNMLFGRQLDADKQSENKKRKNGEFCAPSGFNPTDPYYDPQLRLKQRLRTLLPHLPLLPGMPPRHDQKD